jgi:hypothetical protein
VNPTTDPPVVFVFVLALVLLLVFVLILECLVGIDWLASDLLDLLD